MTAPSVPDEPDDLAVLQALILSWLDEDWGRFDLRRLHELGHHAMSMASAVDDYVHLVYRLDVG
jgi:hypothetical protein